MKMSNSTSPCSKSCSQKAGGIGKVSRQTVQPLSPSSDSGKSGRSSPDPTCAICLGKHENKSFTNKCFHEFCFTCLLEWSKVKPECPLCKQEFSAILHNIRSNEDYDEHKIEIMEPEEPDLSALDLVHNRFRYRTTLTQDRRRLLAWQRLIRMRDLENGVLPNAARPRRPARRNGTSSFRRAIYFQRDLWVRPLSDITGRFRQTTPEFFQLNPAMTHRLVPWLNRELNVLLTNHEDRVSYVLELIMRMITQNHICSRAFREALQEFTGAQTEHFIHEFFQFARSPFDMHGFDENANYQPRNSISHEEVALTDESTDEDTIPPPTISTTISTSALDVPLAPSPQPGPSGLGRSVTLSDDGQSYSVSRLQANSSGTTSVTPSGTPSDEEDVAVVQVVRPASPEIITLSDSDQDGDQDDDRNKKSKQKEEEDVDDEEMTAASSSSTRGKALKRRLISSTNRSRKDKSLKKTRRKKSRTSRTSRTSR